MRCRRGEASQWLGLSVRPVCLGRGHCGRRLERCGGTGRLHRRRINPLGFFNVQQGDAPYLKQLADAYSMSDNYHQAVNGGTGANHIMLGTGDAIWFSDGNGHPAVPPNNPVNPANPGTPLPGYTSALNEIENPNPQPGTNNFYTQDGYGGGSGSPTATAPNANYGGGSYTNCADLGQPGVAVIVSYLQALPRVMARKEKGRAKFASKRRSNATISSKSEGSARK